MTRASLAVALMFVATAAQAQGRTFYGADGKVSGRSTTDTSGATTVYDSAGRVSGRTSTGSDGTTTVYGSDGRRVGTITKQAGEHDAG